MSGHKRSAAQGDGTQPSSKRQKYSTMTPWSAGQANGAVFANVSVSTTPSPGGASFNLDFPADALATPTTLPKVGGSGANDAAAGAQVASGRDFPLTGGDGGQMGIPSRISAGVRMRQVRPAAVAGGDGASVPSLGLTPVGVSNTTAFNTPLHIVTPTAADLNGGARGAGSAAYPPANGGGRRKGPPKPSIDVASSSDFAAPQKKISDAAMTLIELSTPPGEKRSTAFPESGTLVLPGGYSGPSMTFEQAQRQEQALAKSAAGRNAIEDITEATFKVWVEANFDKDKSQHSYKTPQGQKLLAWLQDNCTAMVKGFTTKYTGFNKGRSGIRRNHGVYFCTYPRCGKCWVSFTDKSASSHAYEHGRRHAKSDEKKRKAKAEREAKQRNAAASGGMRPPKARSNKKGSTGRPRGRPRGSGRPKAPPTRGFKARTDNNAADAGNRLNLPPVPAGATMYQISDLSAAVGQLNAGLPPVGGAGPGAIEMGNIVIGGGGTNVVYNGVAVNFGGGSEVAPAEAAAAAAAAAAAGGSASSKKKKKPPIPRISTTDLEPGKAGAPTGLAVVGSSGAIASPSTPGGTAYTRKTPRSVGAHGKAMPTPPGRSAGLAEASPLALASSDFAAPSFGSTYTPNYALNGGGQLSSLTPLPTDLSTPTFGLTPSGGNQ